MQIAIIGTGYVGLVSGACFAEFGMNVICVDRDRKKIDLLNNGKIPIYEPGLSLLVKNNVSKNRLVFSLDLKKAVIESDVIFIAVGTPSRRGDGHADLTHVYDVAKDIALSINKYKIIVTKSTVPVGTCSAIKKFIKEKNPLARFDIVSNPEFLREGAAINDFMRPDRVVIGLETKKAKAIMAKLYRPLYLLETPIVYTTLETAELIKYASNAFLATKIAFINEISDLCEKCNADVQDISKGLGLDKRIGSKFLHVSPGYGGSCFPKDTLALLQTANHYDSSLSIVESVISSNNKRKLSMVDKIIKACGGSVNGKKISILGVTFKPNTDDVRESASLLIITELQKIGAKIIAYDPQGMSEARKTLNNVKWGNDAYSAMEGVDAVVLVTEWNEFRALDLVKVKGLLKTPTIIDLRNIYNINEMIDLGFNYTSLGRA